VKEGFSRKPNYAWLIFIGCCMCAMSVMPLGVMIFGVYLLPLAEATGSDIVTTSVYMTINGWGMAVTAIVWGWLLSKTKGNSQFKIICIVIALFGVLGPLWNASIAPQFGIWGYYIGSAIFSLSGGSLMVMIPMTMISNWFGPKIRGKIFGFVSASGIIGTLTIPPLFTAILQSTGLNVTFLLHAIIMGFFTIIPCAIIFRKRDDDVLPWGVKSWEELEETEGANAAKYGFPAKRILLTIPFWLILLCQITETLHGGLANNMIGATGYWLGLVGSPEAANFAMIGALMMSVGSISEAISKIAIGAIIDKWGPGIGCSIFIAIPVIGMLIWTLIPASLVTMYLGAILFGCLPATIVVGMPLLIRMVFGERTYPVAQSYVAAVNTFLSGLAAPFIAWIIVTGSYSTAYLFACGVFAIPIVAYLFIGRYVGKLPWVDVDGNPMPTGKEGA
jgi:MFS family permease